MSPPSSRNMIVRFVSRSRDHRVGRARSFVHTSSASAMAARCAGYGTRPFSAWETVEMLTRASDAQFQLGQSPLPADLSR